MYNYFYEYKDMDSTIVQENIKHFRDSVVKILYDNKELEKIKSSDIIRM